MTWNVPEYNTLPPVAGLTPCLVVNDPALRSDIVSLEVTSGKLKAE